MRCSELLRASRQLLFLVRARLVRATFFRSSYAFSSPHHAATAPRSAVAELEVVRQPRTFYIMKHLQLDESASSALRIAFRIIGPTGSLFEQWFHQLLSERQELQAFRPELSGSILRLDATTLPGVADAFDTVVGQAHGAVEHVKEVDQQKRQLDEQAKQDTLANFRQSQGL